jgi:hypothetical protein
MKKLVSSILLMLFLLPACGSLFSTHIRAAYLVQSPGQLSQAELAKHPEIFVTSSFSAFRQVARQPIGLWIDKNALILVDSNWLDQPPQSLYPIIVIGFNDPLRSFRDGLTLCCFAGPAMPDYSGAEPGFSIIMRLSGKLGAPTTMLQGFKQIPHVDDILRISNALLDGKIRPTATVPPPYTPSATPP